MKAFWIVLLLGLVSKNGPLIHGLHKMVPIARKITFSGRSESLIRHFERSVRLYGSSNGTLRKDHDRLNGALFQDKGDYMETATEVIGRL